MFLIDPLAYTVYVKYIDKANRFADKTQATEEIETNIPPVVEGGALEAAG